MAGDPRGGLGACGAVGALNVHRLLAGAEGDGRALHASRKWDLKSWFHLNPAPDLTNTMEYHPGSVLFSRKWNGKRP